MIQFKRHDDEWRVYGPADELHVGEVTVTKKSGRAKAVWIERIVPARAKDGVEMAYGLIGHAPAPEPAVVTTELGLPREAPAVDSPWQCDGHVAIGRSDSTAGDLLTGSLAAVIDGEVRTVGFDANSITTVGIVGGVRMVAVAVTDRPAVQPQRKPARQRVAGRGGICDECQQPRRNLQECVDSSGIPGLCCPRCASSPAYTRSFA